MGLARACLGHGPEGMTGLVQQRFAEETFVHVMDKGGIPHTRHVRGSNYNLISVFPDRISGRAIIISGRAQSSSYGPSPYRARLSSWRLLHAWP